MTNACISKRNPDKPERSSGTASATPPPSPQKGSTKPPAHDRSSGADTLPRSDTFTLDSPPKADPLEEAALAIRAYATETRSLLDGLLKHRMKLKQRRTPATKEHALSAFDSHFKVPDGV